MTVRELIEKLRGFPQDHSVILAADSEGNGHSPLYSAWPAQYVPENSWSGHVVTDEDGEEYGWTGNDCVVLTPTN